MLNTLTPLTLGAAAAATAAVARAVPTPGDFLALFQRAGEKPLTPGDTASAIDRADKPTAAADKALARTELSRLLRGIETKLDRALGRGDVDQSQPVRLRLDASQRVRAVDRPNDAAKIEQLIADEPGLDEEIRRALRSLNAATDSDRLENELPAHPSGVALDSPSSKIAIPTLTFHDGRLTVSPG